MKNPDCTLLVLLHGLFGSKEDWDPLLPLLSAHYDCIALDLPGHGQRPYAQDILATLSAVLQGFARSKLVLIGYSLGGRVALQLRDLAHSVIALSAHPGIGTLYERQAQQEKERYWLKQLLTQPLDQFLHAWYAQPLFSSLSKSPHRLLRLIQNRASQDPQILAKVFYQLRLSVQTPLLVQSANTLFIAGEKDSKYQELYSKMGLFAKTLTQSGHACLVENPIGCAELIIQWLEGIDAYNRTDAMCCMAHSKLISRY